MKLTNTQGARSLPQAFNESVWQISAIFIWRETMMHGEGHKAGLDRWRHQRQNIGGAPNRSREFVQPQFTSAELEYFGPPCGLKFIVQFHLSKFYELTALNA
jgi:hypothetical protein